MDRVTVPDESLSIAIGRIKDGLEFLDALLGTVETENALDLGGFELSVQFIHSIPSPKAGVMMTHPSLSERLRIWRPR